MANIDVTCIFMVLVDRLTVDYDIIYCLSMQYSIFLVNLIRYGIELLKNTKRLRGYGLRPMLNANNESNNRKIAVTT